MGVRFEKTDWYDAPLYYDIVFDEDTQKEGWFLEKMREKYGGTGGHRALEPACGSGRLVEEMARRGWDVTGFDLSKPMLEFTAKRLRRARLKASLHEARMQEFSFAKKFDVAHCLVSTFKYLLTEDDCRDHLQCVANCLKPGGLYVLGFHLSEYDNDSKARERWVGERDGTRVVCNIQSWPPEQRKRREWVRSRLVVEKGGATHRFETSWWFRTYDASQVRRLFRKVPDLEHVATYDFTYRLDRKRVLDDEQLDNVFILRKR